VLEARNERSFFSFFLSLSPGAGGSFFCVTEWQRKVAVILGTRTALCSTAPTHRRFSWE